MLAFILAYGLLGVGSTRISQPDWRVARFLWCDLLKQPDDTHPTLLFWVISVSTSVVYVLPTIAVALAAYGLLTQWFSCAIADGELHCRRCKHILRGLSQPRCPECGESI